MTIAAVLFVLVMYFAGCALVGDEIGRAIARASEAK